MMTDITHKVVSGDTLSKIAKKYGTTIETLKSANGLKSDLIKVGQVLKLSVSTHTVVSGDTLFKIAQKYGTTVETLKSANGLKSDLIKTGQILKLAAEKYSGLFVLQDENGNPLKHLDYEVELSDGSVHGGTTDVTGSTMPVESSEPLQVTDIRVFAEMEVACCAASGFSSARNDIPNPFYDLSELPNLPNDAVEYLKNMAKEYAAKRISRTIVSFKRSLNGAILLAQSKIPRFTIKRIVQTRGLTAGEKKIVRDVFKTAVNPDSVKIHEGEFLGWVQDKQTAMTPDGNIYFPTEIYRSDFSQIRNTAEEKGKDFSDLHTFVHEMVHVWQHQLNYPTMLAGADIASQFGYVKAYAYKYNFIIKKRNHLSEFNMEQQGNIIADDYMYTAHGRDFRLEVSHTDRLRVLQDFKNNPRNRKLLPDSSNLTWTVLGIEIVPKL